MWAAPTSTRDQACFRSAPRDLPQRAISDEPKRKKPPAQSQRLGSRREKLLVLLALCALGPLDEILGRGFRLGGRVLHRALGGDVHQHLARLLLGELERRTTGLAEVLEVALGLGHVAFAEVGLTALELRLVVVLLRLDRLRERLDRLVLVRLVLVAHAEHVPDVALIGAAGNVRRALARDRDRLIRVVPLAIELAERDVGSPLARVRLDRLAELLGRLFGLVSRAIDLAEVVVRAPQTGVELDGFL